MQTRYKPPYDLSDTELADAGSAADAVACFRMILFCNAHLRRRLDDRLKSENLTSQQGILLTIVRTRDPPTLGEVATAMSTTHQNAKQIALVLERKGMIRFSKDPTDGRIMRLTATKDGLRVWQNRDVGDFAAIGEWFATLSPGEQKKLKALLGQLAVALDT
jgi:DNA-binding MarR family transcriptional regulator